MILSPTFIPQLFNYADYCVKYCVLVGRYDSSFCFIPSPCLLGVVVLEAGSVFGFERWHYTRGASPSGTLLPARCAASIRTTAAIVALAGRQELCAGMHALGLLGKSIY